MILEALDQLLAEHCTAAFIHSVEARGPVANLWDPIERGGFLELALPEELGGAGMQWKELFPILERLGRSACPVPLAQSIVARSLVQGSGALPAGMLTISTGSRRTRGSLSAPAVPYGAISDFLLVPEGSTLLLLRCADAVRVDVGDPRSLVANLTWHDVQPAGQFESRGEPVQRVCAAMGAAMLSGALQNIFDMTLDYCNTRVQFGKSIGKFQAIQQQISVMAEHVLAAAVAAESAFATPESGPSMLTSAIAKTRTSEAAGMVAAIAHAVHGAIGMTDEYALGLLTRRLRDWRVAYGSEHTWNTLLGQQLLATDSTVADFVRIT